MELKMDVYTSSLSLAGLLEVQRSVIWEEKAFTAGSFSVESLITDQSRALLIPENIIWLEGDTAGIIEHIDQEAGEDGPHITAQGRDLTGILDRRILWGLYDLYGTVPEIMYRLVDDCCINPTRGDVASRKIPGLVLAGAAPAGGEKIRLQKTGGTLLEALEELGGTYNVAFGVRFNPAVPHMEFWARPGIDRSIHQNTNEQVFYSTELDDVLSSEYTYDSSKYRTIALVAGEGEGADRTMITVEGAAEPEPTPPEPTTYTISLSVDPQGGGVASGGGTVQDGASVTVTAAAANGYTFSGWRENGAIISTSQSYTFTVTGDRSLTAVFAAEVQNYSIVTAVDPAGAGTASGGGTYTQGQSVTLQAVPAGGYQFVAWRENGADVSTDAAYTFTASGNRTITAVFAAITYTVTTSIDPTGSGTATGAGTYQQGASVTVTAAPGDGYKFVKWTESGQAVSESVSYTFAVSGDRALTAVFEVEKTSRLPDGYTEVEWIQNGTGTSKSIIPYIAGLPAYATATKIEIQVSSTHPQYYNSAALMCLFGKDTTTSSTVSRYCFATYNKQFVYCYGNNNQRKALGTPTNGGKHTLGIDLDSGVFTVDGATTSASTYKTIRTRGNAIFAPGNGTTGVNSSSYAAAWPYLMRLYYLKMWDTNGSLVLDMVPCINPSGVIGMYDTVGKIFYKNSNTSTNAANKFIAGPAV